MAEDAFLELPTHRLRYRIDGAPGAGTPWLLFCNSLGTDLGMWEAQAGALARHFRVLRLDGRGHGRSSTPPPPYALADLGGDVLALMDALGIAQAHFCGLSIGGLTGQWLGLHAGGRLGRIVLCATAARIGTPEGWAARRSAVEAHGLAPLAGATAERWFTPAFRAANPAPVADILATFGQVDPDGYGGCCAALAGADLRADIGRIANPVLAISGEDDPVCAPADLCFIADQVAAGRHVCLPGRHMVNIESAGAFNAVVRDFLAG